MIGHMSPRRTPFVSVPVAVLIVAALAGGCSGPSDESADDPAPIADVSDGDRVAACAELARLGSLPARARSAPDQAKQLFDDLDDLPSTTPGGSADEQLESLRRLVLEDLSFVLDGGDYLLGEGVDVIVFLQPDVRTSVLDEINDELESEPAVESVEFFDQRESYEEFQKFFADEPELVDSVTPDILPPSFRLGLSEPVDESVDRIVESMEGRSGVREVTRGPWADPVDHEREIAAMTDRIAEVWGCSP